MATQCLITGCALVDRRRGAWVWGDLHQVGDCYAFVACVHETGGLAWEYQDPVRDGKSLTVDYNAPREFESRGVLVIPTSDAELSEAAKAYIVAGRCGL